jgi:hypothetical protein
MDGLDAFGEITDDNFFSDEFSSDVMTEDEIVSTPPPSSPLPYANTSMDIKLEYHSSCDPDFSAFKSDPYSHMAAQTWQQRQLYLQYQQYQYHVLQQKLLMSALQLPPVSHMYPPSPAPAMPVPEPVCARGIPPCSDMSARDVSRTFEDPRQHLAVPDTPLKLTSLDASHFGTNIAPYPKLKSIPVDISGNLSDAQYNKIFKKYHLHLQLDSHPTMTEQDLEEIKIHGRMYFLKNVKTIVPKVGPWKFNAHISHRRSDERQYNIPGMAVTCKVKEWLTDDGLWRLYHYKRGKTVKVKKLDVLP